MPAVNISAFGGIGWQFFDNAGNVLSGGKIFTYLAGTTINQPTYTSASGAVAHTNPIILDSAGRVSGGEIWLVAATLYKFVLKTSTDVTIATYDNISSSGAAGNYVNNFTGTGIQVNFTLSNTPFNENTTQVYINGVYQQKNTYAIVGTTLTFSEAPPITSSIEVLYF